MSSTARFAALALTLAACGADPDGGVPDPIGEWVVTSVTVWECATQDGDPCLPAESFDPLPEDAILRADGSLTWWDVVHHGTFGGGCLNVPAAAEDGRQRSAYSFCMAVDRFGDPIIDHATVSITWDAGTASECTCGADFVYVGPE